MARFVNPYPQFFDDTGTPLSNGTITFYAAGTSNLQSIYTNVGLTVAATNPAPLDADGRTNQNIFLSTSSYRVVLKNASGSSIWDIDNFQVADTTDVQALIDQLTDDIANLDSSINAQDYLVNGGFQVDLAGITGSALSLTTSYQNSATGWASACLVAVSAGTATIVTTPQIGLSGHVLKYAGVSCGSTGTPALRYQSLAADAANLSSKTITITATVQHDVGSAVPYTISLYTANAADNYAAVTSTGLSSTTSVASGTATTISLTATLGDVDNGLEIRIIAAPGQALTTKNFYWSDVALRATSTVLPYKVRLYRQDYWLTIDPSTVLDTGDFATQAQMEAASSNTVIVTPGVVKYSPLVSKAWVDFAGQVGNGACVVNASNNIASVTRSASGTYDVVFTTAMSTANYCVVTSAFDAGSSTACTITAKATTGFTILFNTLASVATNPTSGFAVVFGDFA